MKIQLTTNNKKSTMKSTSAGCVLV